MQIAELQKLLHYICENGFEHHVAANFSTTAAAVHEAAVRYLGWQMHWHGNYRWHCGPFRSCRNSLKWT